MSEKINPEYVSLIYTDNDNEQYIQPVNDLVEAGTMMNPDTGEEFSLQHVHIAGNTTPHNPSYVTIVYVDEHGNKHEQSVHDAVLVGELLSPHTGDTMIIDHIII